MEINIQLKVLFLSALFAVVHCDGPETLQRQCVEGDKLNLQKPPSCMCKREGKNG